MIINPNRRDINRIRRKLTEQQKREASQLSALHLLNIFRRLPKRAKVAIYLPAFGELPTQPIVDWCKRYRYQVFLPVVGTLGHDNKIMRFSKINSSKLSTLRTVPHQLGMQQFIGRKLLRVNELDAIFCPLVAADLHGNRMGMGGGYYDCTLASVVHNTTNKPLRIGWCYDFQVVKQLQTQPWDVSLDALITPSQLRWFKRSII